MDTANTERVFYLTASLDVPVAQIEHILEAEHLGRGNVQFTALLRVCSAKVNSFHSSHQHLTSNRLGGHVHIFLLFPIVLNIFCALLTRLQMN